MGYVTRIKKRRFQVASGKGLTIGTYTVALVLKELLNSFYTNIITTHVTARIR